MDNNNNNHHPHLPPPSSASWIHRPTPYHLLLQQQLHQFQTFWSYQRTEIDQADEDVRMISIEAPILFAKACELFILELTIRSWLHAEENKRRTLQNNDIAAAFTRTDVFDFLVDIVPREEIKEEDVTNVRN